MEIHFTGMNEVVEKNERAATVGEKTTVAISVDCIPDPTFDNFRASNSVDRRF